MKKAFLVFLVLGLFISCQSEKEQAHFLNVKIQESESRSFSQEKLTLEFERDLETLGIYTFATFAETKDHFIVVENEELVIRYLNKSDLTVQKTFKIEQGRGPQELEYIMAFDASDEVIAFADNNLLKIILFDHQGNLVNEFSTKRKPFRLNVSPNRGLNLLYIYYIDKADSTFLFNLNEFGDVNYAFQKENYEEMHPFSTNGTIKTVNDTLYYVGGYDPYIKKYVRGEKVYSRATIDNYDSSLNYITVISNDSRSTSLSPAAIFSSRDFDVKKGSIFVIPYSNGDNDFSFIDVYASKDGSYIESFRTIDVPDKINVYEDERSILTIEKVEDLEKPVFRKYSY